MYKKNQILSVLKKKKPSKVKPDAFLSFWRIRTWQCCKNIHNYYSEYQNGFTWNNQSIKKVYPWLVTKNHFWGKQLDMKMLFMQYIMRTILRYSIFSQINYNFKDWIFSFTFSGIGDQNSPIVLRDTIKRVAECRMDE